jgi:transketolase
MRNAFSRAMTEEVSDPRLVFLTGDLGFKALEPLRDALGERFINAGVAEQNMVSTAAGLARAGMRPWVYSIAPFVYARPFEQIRNDVCMHDLPVRLVGNGGGYGYGVMGATHHALEDYGAMLTLDHMRTFMPAFAGDVAAAVRFARDFPHPMYLRLGLAEEPKDYPLPPYAPWRKLIRGGSGVTLVVIGTLAGKLLPALAELEEPVRPNMWVLAELPLADVPADLTEDVFGGGHLFVAEEHVAHGGAGHVLAHHFLSTWADTPGRKPPRFTHRCALRYPSGRYGSQGYHRKECGLDVASIVAELRRLGEHR